ncbi:MAG TPA: SDR family NAD(P)-dependent oxidoreductase [Deltaproteobacteria bacterium]|nr:MAG: 3-oxoacyl-(acyl-carrier-protein) reductase FabG [Deltaproteobacteria bacterium ADurb.Bin072]HNS91163.1 SDR family NAD(P)-dependent oxidoreductase [Deltaproteobacteria bacterium]
MKLDFTEKTVLVTGASMGIGRGLAGSFARDGANLALTDLPARKAELDAFADELERAHGIRTWRFSADLTEPDGPERLHDEVVMVAGPVQVLVNNAGICSYGCFADMDLARMEKIVALNCIGYMKLMRLVLPSMMDKDDGAILNVSSVSAFQPLPSLAVYAATKAFTLSLSEAVTGELPWRSKIVVATMNPPFTRTALINDAGIPRDFIPFTISFKTIDEVVEQGYRAFKQGKLCTVPGWQNRALHLVMVRLLPRKAVSLVGRLTMRRWSDYVRI